MASMRLVEGARVDYYSSSYKSWIPAAITRVDPETGDVAIDVKPSTKFNMRAQAKSIRPRSKPTMEHIKWMRSCVREGHLEAEAAAFYDRYADRYRDDSLLFCSELSADLDCKLGISGSTIQLNYALRVKGASQLSREDFRDIFADIVWQTYNKYGITFVQDSIVPQRQEDPKHSYEFQKCIGSGTYGSVYLATCCGTTTTRAIKKMAKATYGGPLAQIDPEIENLISLDHPHIVKLYEHFDFVDNIYLVMDYCSGGELQQKISRHTKNRREIKETFIIEVMRQVLMAITYVHGRGIMHLDLKGQNIMLMPSKGTLPPARKSAGHTLAPAHERPHVMVIDLGIAQLFRPGNFCYGEPCGTPVTMAPEVWDGVLTPKADVFSLGVVLFQLMALRLPFSGVGSTVHEAVPYWATKPEPPWQSIASSSERVIQMCRQMLLHDRHQRPTASKCRQLVSSSSFHVPDVPEAMLQGFKKWSERTVLQKSVALAIAHAWPANQLPTIKRIFHELDTKGRGRLDTKQIASVFEKLGIERQKANAAAKSFDLSQDGTVGWTEFVAACVHLSDDAMDEDLFRIFQAADSNGDGFLDSDDFNKLLHANVCDDDWQDVLVDLCGHNGQGSRVDWPQFRRHFRSKSLTDDAVMLEEDQKNEEDEELKQEAASASDATTHEAQAPSSPPQRGRASVTPMHLSHEDAGVVSQVQEFLHKARGRFFQDENAENLQALLDMGLTDREKNIQILRRHGNLLNERVIVEILDDAA